MKDDMSFVEGCYRLPNKQWQIFIFLREQDTQNIIIQKDIVWESGNTGIVINVLKDIKINKNTVLRVLSDALNVVVWSEIHGPDSMQLR